MKLVILKSVKIKGKLAEKGSIVEIDNEAGDILVAGGFAEAPRKNIEVKAEVAPEMELTEPEVKPIRKGKK